MLKIMKFSKWDIENKKNFLGNIKNWIIVRLEFIAEYMYIKDQFFSHVLFQF